MLKKSDTVTIGGYIIEKKNLRKVVLENGRHYVFVASGMRIAVNNDELPAIKGLLNKVQDWLR